MWTKELFGTSKPIIAMLHLDPLPGDPLWNKDCSMEQVIEDARKDLISLQEGGVDGVLISNEFSLPYADTVNSLTTNAMARVIGSIENILSIPFGIDVISDPFAALNLAAAVDADFIREGFSGATVGGNGVRSKNLAEAMRYRHAIGLDHVKMMFFLNPESEWDLNCRSYEIQAKALVFSAHPDGLCVFGGGAGMDVDSNLVERVHDAVAGQTMVFCSNGCKPSSIREKLSVSDGAIVGTYFKQDGKFCDENHGNLRIQKERVETLMKEVKDFRKD